MKLLFLLACSVLVSCNNFFILIGPSNSGKSTFLHNMGISALSPVRQVESIESTTREVEIYSGACPFNNNQKTFFMDTIGFGDSKLTTDEEILRLISAAFIQAEELDSSAKAVFLLFENFNSDASQWELVVNNVKLAFGESVLSSSIFVLPFLDQAKEDEEMAAVMEETARQILNYSLPCFSIDNTDMTNAEQFRAILNHPIQGMSLPALKTAYQQVIHEAQMLCDSQAPEYEVIQVWQEFPRYATKSYVEVREEKISDSEAMTLAFQEVQRQDFDGFYEDRNGSFRPVRWNCPNWPIFKLMPFEDYCRILWRMREKVKQVSYTRSVETIVKDKKLVDQQTLRPKKKMESFMALARKNVSSRLRMKPQITMK